MSSFVNLVVTKGRFSLLLILLLSSAAQASGKLDLENSIDSFMSHLMENLDVVPGYSIAVVTPDATIMAKGYGVTAATDGQPMRSSTQVYIASSTKSLTGLAVASLANKGLINLDTPIQEYMSALKGSAAGRVSFRQLLSHTHGLEEEALTWRTAFSGQYSSETLLRLVEEMEYSDAPDDFDYSNTGYVVASLVLEHRFDKSWKDIVAEEVLAPVGLSSTTAFVSALYEHYALPHSWYGEKNEIPLSKRDNTMHAAGGHFSTANDMALWLQLQLNDGKVKGREVYPRGLVASTHIANASLETEFFSYKRHHYGLGWYQADYRGHLMFHHFGSFAGYRSHISFIPDLEIGVAVLINDASRPGFYLPDVIANYIYDLAANVEASGDRAREEVAKIATMIEPIAGRRPPERPRNAPDDEVRFAGSYSNNNFGTIRFEMAEGRLIASFGNLLSETTYKDDGAIRMELIPYEGTLGRFVINDQGEVIGFEHRGAHYTRLGSQPR